MSTTVEERSQEIVRLYTLAYVLLDAKEVKQIYAKLIELRAYDEAAVVLAIAQRLERDYEVMA